MSFAETLSLHGAHLERGRCGTLQVNLGLRCDQACRHCHLEAGPDRTESMDRSTMDQVVELARRYPFEVVDLTGGAPELNPDLPYLIREIAPLAKRIYLRANLSALMTRWEVLIPLLREHRVVTFASLPAVQGSATDRQRGKGVFDRSIQGLRLLNKEGWGREGSGLELNLISNPAGAFLPPDQIQAEALFRQRLSSRHGIEFNQLYCFANVPLGRFRRWLEASGNLTGYLEKLSGAFNPCALEGVMCRSLISVGWDGRVYDCDFNLAAGLDLGGRRVHVSELQVPPGPGEAIAVADHCYACTAGAGFT